LLLKTIFEGRKTIVQQATLPEKLVDQIEQAMHKLPVHTPQAATELRMTLP
jgi:hypothetical protein